MHQFVRPPASAATPPPPPPPLHAVPTAGASATVGRRRARSSQRAVALSFAVVSIAAAAATAWAVTTPATHPSSRTSSETQRLDWTYTAPTHAGATYPTGRVQTGEPVFLRLVDTLTVEVTATPGAAPQLEAELTAPDGWHTALPLRNLPVVDGGSARATLDVRDVTARLRAMSTETGAPSGAATVTITAAPTGSSGSAATLTFTDDGVGLRPDLTTLHGTRSITAQGTGTAATSLAIGRWHFRVVALRWLLAAVTALTTVGCLAASRWRTRKPFPGRNVVEADHTEIAAGRSLVTVSRAGTLRRIARAENRPIVAGADNGGTAYLVDDGITIYRYAAGGSGRHSRRGNISSRRRAG